MTSGPAATERSRNRTRESFAQRALVASVIAWVALTVWMLAVESGGQEELRRFTSDVGSDRWVGIVTTASVALLFAAGVMHLAVLTVEPRVDRDWRLYHGAQGLLLIALSIDDRLLVHEWLGGVIGIRDGIIMGGYGLVALAIVAFAPPGVREVGSMRLLVAAGAAFAVMVVVDSFVPSDAPGRLAIEDSSKLAGVVALMLHSVYLSVRTIRASA